MTDAVDVYALLETVDGDRVLLASLVGMFLDDAEARMAALEASVASRDRDATVSVAHKLAGAAGMLHVRGLAAIVRGIEVSAREASIGWDALTERVADARAELGRAAIMLAPLSSDSRDR